MAGDFLSWAVKPGLIDLGAAPQAVPDIKGVYWLQRNKKMDRALKWLEITGVLIIIVMLAGGLVVYGWEGMKRQWRNRDATVSWSLISMLAIGLLLLVLVSQMGLK